MEGRAEAVTNAVMQAKENDVVLVAVKAMKITRSSATAVWIIPTA